MALDFPSSPADGDVYGNYVYDSSAGAWRYGALLLAGLPAGGTANQVLSKIDSADYNAQWTAIPDSQNYIINGNFDFWQRGTSFTADGYSADRWYFDETGACTVSQATTSLPTGVTYALQAFSSTASDSADIYQVLEQAVVIPLRGKTVTFSAYLKMDANMRLLGDFEMVADYSNSTDARASQTTAIGTTVLTKSLFNDWARATYTFTVPSDAVGLKVGFEPPLTTATYTTSTYWISKAQLEVGSSATDFKLAGGTYVAELQECQRYYLTGGVSSGYVVSGSVGGYRFTDSLPVTMRVTPTMTNLSFTNVDNAANGGHTAVNARQVQTNGGVVNGAFAYLNGSWTYSASAEL
jgi:hypothetical protein